MTNLLGSLRGSLQCIQVAKSSVATDVDCKSWLTLLIELDTVTIEIGNSRSVLYE